MAVYVHAASRLHRNCEVFKATFRPGTDLSRPFGEITAGRQGLPGTTLTPQHPGYAMGPKGLRSVRRIPHGNSSVNTEHYGWDSRVTMRGRVHRGWLNGDRHVRTGSLRHRRRDQRYHPGENACGRQLHDANQILR